MVWLRETSNPYPPKSLYAILCGLYQISQSNGVSFNFLDKKDTRFAVLYRTFDSIFSTLHSQGVGTSKKSAEVIPIEEEEMLLDSKVFSMDDPESLLYMVFFLCGSSLLPTRWARTSKSVGRAVCSFSFGYIPV